MYYSLLSSTAFSKNESIFCLLDMELWHGSYEQRNHFMSQKVGITTFTAICGSCHNPAM